MMTVVNNRKNAKILGDCLKANLESVIVIIPNKFAIIFNGVKDKKSGSFFISFSCML